MRLSLLSLLIATVLISSCKEETKTENGSETKTEAPPAPKADPESNLGERPTAELLNILSAYYSLKDALVATDAAKTEPAASKLMASTEIFKDEITQLPQYTDMQPHIKDIMAGADAIVSNKDIEVKRTQFSIVSDALHKILKQANLKNGGIYQQYCPMAFNDKGAYWLSAESDIKNPYFGKKMLACGEVRDSL